jgi:hypothetical protein
MKNKLFRNKLVISSSTCYFMKMLPISAIKDMFVGSISVTRYTCKCRNRNTHNLIGRLWVSKQKHSQYDRPPVSVETETLTIWSVTCKCRNRNTHNVIGRPFCAIHRHTHTPKQLSTFLSVTKTSWSASRCDAARTVPAISQIRLDTTRYTYKGNSSVLRWRRWISSERHTN